MKLQHLVIIFLIIIVPIALVLSTYINGYIDTIKRQSSYDAYLLNATYDGIKAFQLNTASNSYSTIGNSKIRDIEAAISTFFSSLSTNLGFSGYSEDDVRQHVPAILFNLYDGYYIYSNYYDTESDTYKYGLKPFMYYSCRYVKGSNYDFVVNYTLDNTITVIGIVDGNYVTKTGHLILDDGFAPETEILTEDLITLDNQGVDTSYTKESYQYTIYNSQKIYKENGINEIALSYHFGIQDDISAVKSSMLDGLIENLVENGFQVKLMTTLSSDNYKMISTMCSKAYEFGAKTIKFTNYIYQGNAQKNDFTKVLNQEQIDEVLSEIDYCRSLYDKEDLKIERCGTFGPKQGNSEKFECLACNNMAVITPDLNVYQCVFDIDRGNEIGRVIDGKIMIDDEYKSLDKSYCKVLKKYNGIGGQR